MNEAHKSPKELKQAIQALREKIIKQVQENAKRREDGEMSNSATKYATLSKENLIKVKAMIKPITDELSEITTAIKADDINSDIKLHFIESAADRLDTFVSILIDYLYVKQPENQRRGNDD